MPETIRFRTIRTLDVKASSRLADSPSCIVSDDEDPSMQMAQMMKTMGQTAPALKPILEVVTGTR